MYKLNEEIPVLDKGFIIWNGSLGDDKRIVDAARVSYAKGTVKKSSDRNLTRYLIKHRHMTPLEMVEFSFQIKAPIFVARQWFRHRIAEYNEMSLRYSECPDDFYYPDEWRSQDSKNRQASAEPLRLPAQVKCRDLCRTSVEHSLQTYNSMLEAGAAREQARIVLPTNLYTTWYWKINARALANFVSLRDAEGAQWEIQQYAKILRGVMKQQIPIAVEALEDFQWA